MDPWLRSLLDLRPRFLSRASDDLFYLNVRACLTVDQAKSILERGEHAEESPRTDALSLPEDSRWQNGKPVVFDVVRWRWQTDPEVADEAADRGRLVICYRHVLFGTADACSTDDLWLWADEAGRCLAARPTSQFGGGDRFTWLNYVAFAARQSVPRSPLRAECYSGIPALTNRVDGPHYVRLLPSLFQASVQTIDLIWHHRKALFEGSAPPPPALKRRGRGGRPVDTDPKRDKKIYTDFKARRLTYQEFARERGIDEKVVRASVDRHRKRVPKPKPPQPGQ
jgi:hypothetical protein